MWDILFFPFRMIGSIIGMVFDFVGSLFSFVFGLVGGIFNMVFGLGFLALVIIGVVALVRWLGRGMQR